VDREGSGHKRMKAVDFMFAQFVWPDAQPRLVCSQQLKRIQRPVERPTDNFIHEKYSGRTPRVGIIVTYFQYPPSFTELDEELFPDVPLLHGREIYSVGLVELTMERRFLNQPFVPSTFRP